MRSHCTLALPHLDRMSPPWPAGRRRSLGRYRLEEWGGLEISQGPDSAAVAPPRCCSIASPCESRSITSPLSAQSLPTTTPRSLLSVPRRVECVGRLGAVFARIRAWYRHPADP